MVSSKKTIVVVGATGNQGSSVAHTFLELTNWNVRCLTRNPSSDASKALSNLGAEVVQGDLSDASSLSKAFVNANAIFVNTDFWEQYIANQKNGMSEPEAGKAAYESEVLWGKNAAHAAAAVPSLDRFVYSALAGAKELSKGKYSNSYHHETKATIVKYIENDEPELAKKASFIYMGGYTSNPLLNPSFDAATGEYKFVGPLSKDHKLPIIDPKNSTGPFVRALVEDEPAGTKLLAYDSHITIGEVVALWSKASGKEAHHMQVTTQFLEKMGRPKEVLDGIDAFLEYGYMAGIDGWTEPPQLKKQVHTKSFEEFLNEKDWEKELEALKTPPVIGRSAKK
jgi:hypothetical protein